MAEGKSMIDGEVGQQMGFKEPERKIYSAADLDSFKESEVYTQLVAFLEALSASVQGLKSRDSVHVSPVTEKLVALLASLDELANQCVPQSNPTRYGNPAFRDWYALMDKNVIGLLEPIVKPQEAIMEVKEYLLGSFGSEQRIDFGTGHEASFVVFLYCLNKLNVINKEDYAAVVLHVFQKYIDLTFKLQTRYWIEPAGSHGVWGLDDYHFLPFYFGASQLCGHTHIRPRAIHYAEYVDNFAPDYMYLKCIQNINSVKTESLAWHSPMLNDISAVKTWSKVHSGLMKMYKAEVLGKLPIMQHLKFGSLLAFESTAPPPTEEDLDSTKHIEVFATCCAQSVPSAAAARAMRTAEGGAMGGAAETGSLSSIHDHSHGVQESRHSHSHAHQHSHDRRLLPFD